MKPINEQSNQELRETVQKLWDVVFTEVKSGVISALPPYVPPTPPPKTSTVWSYEPNKKVYRHIDAETGQTSFHEPESLPESVKLQLGIETNPISNEEIL